MSTALLYHAWGVDGYLYIRTELVDQAVHFHVRKAEASPACAGCGSTAVTLETSIPVGLVRVAREKDLRFPGSAGL